MTVFRGIMGIRHAHVKLLPLHPVATATVGNISCHFLFLLHTQLLKNIILSVQYDRVWWNLSPTLGAKCKRENNMHQLWVAN